MTPSKVATEDLTAEELKALADRNFREAAATADAKAKRLILANAERLRLLAEVKGWCNSELQPPI